MNWLTAEHLALVFGGLTALSILLYAILDGYDLGVGITLPMGNEAWRDTAIASIGPFWDANETWLVLAVGLLLVAFPAAHSAILHALYLPTAMLLIGLILRGVAFDFRAKVKTQRKVYWDYTFKAGSLLATFSQGFMLGIYVMGLQYHTGSIIFACFSGLCVTAAYAMIGNAWLIGKTSGELQLHAIKHCKIAGVLTLSGILAVSLINPMVNANVLQVWTEPPLAYFFAAIPLLCFAMFVIGYLALKRLPLPKDAGAWLPFAICNVIFISSFIGLALSFYPFVVPNQMTLYQAASSRESLLIIFFGAVVVIPVIAAYTAVAYYAFRGKADGLKYY
ncbi:cytochrome d ubiquinol oxidase subunit II [Alishewanella sp. 16-MA]|uniref:Cytochrome d ubiquinol oxidase subunit II n=1 Tax=Alishewanella maricola TaxID=2795740 RepID=A0ABS8C1Y1_9ALTE|nr:MULTISPECIES: cytochrome d ubiquinol oxidase subunit II [Alishewanella]MDP5035453.1 cytochrome d ubiquinol oxidase subunit II [Alishewanella sp.]MDP5206079.1 cytochrome d ubiquinol oxidase subunit II [Alishewanella sp. SMS9]MCB5226327.1 cytochrome d ubiquinol oxidase subunit II [Alishewanella maricola]MDP5185551.1 cytochrome d ubiquinol oxidase subunit II [Alishewanella sp.]MDP5459000.1 cytochrome d ubiquinol oxidase subunit II [Alishewanella sp. SMS8]